MKTCAHCDMPFVSRKADALYCGTRCQTAAKGRGLGVGDDRLRSTERLVEFYCCDVAGCECEGFKHQATGLMCVRVGRDDGALTDRCLECDTVWHIRDYRSEPLRVISRHTAQKRRAYRRARLSRAA